MVNMHIHVEYVCVKWQNNTGWFLWEIVQIVVDVEAAQSLDDTNDRQVTYSCCRNCRVICKDATVLACQPTRGQGTWRT